MEPAPSPSPTDQHTAAPEEPREFRPAVKIAALVLVVGACLYTGYRVCYKLGREVGFREGLESELVAERVNADAVRNVAYVLQAASADDATLLDHVRRRVERFAWIKDAAVKREVLEMLLTELMRRDMLVQAEDLLDEVLPPTQPDSPVREQRMLAAARGLAAHGKWDKAGAYLQCVEDALVARSVSTEALLRERVDLLGVAGVPREVLLQELESLAARVAKVYPMLSAELYVYLGKMYREQGTADRADAHFRSALAVMENHEQLGVAALPSVCYGVALYETGEQDKAEEWLKRGVELDEHVSPDLRAIALRHLATLCIESNQPMTALAYLHRAEGEATGRIAKGSLFWLCLMEQRAWALYTLQDYESALADFRAALAAADGRDDVLRAQPLEGVARCSVALGRVDDALQAARDCLTLRESLLQGDKVALGRVYNLLGQIYDQAGQVLPAADAYGRAAAVLPENHPARVQVLIGRAYALSQAQQWQAAMQAWEEAIPLIPQEDNAMRQMAQARLEQCMQRTATPQPQPATPQKSTSTSSTHKSRARNSRTRRSR